MIEHCGKERTGNFCDQCGAALKSPSSLASLLHHCKAMAENYKKVADRREAEIATAASDERKEWLAKSRDRKRRLQAKWQGYVDELQTAMAKE